MKYIVAILGIALLMSGHRAQAQCFERADFQVEILDLGETADVLKVTLPENNEGWDCQAFLSGEGKFENAQLDRSANTITIRNLRPGRYYIGLFAPNGCKYALTDPDNVFEDFVISSR